MPKQSQARKYPRNDVIDLWVRSFGMCAFANPVCRRYCIAEETDFDPAKHVSVIAHIVAHGDTGPRADPSLSIKERDCYDNWILMCPTHSVEIDVQPNIYTVDTLRRWKREHEQWANEVRRNATTTVTFQELEGVCRNLLDSPSDPSTDYTAPIPLEKMARNNLTERSGLYLRMGLAIEPVVSNYIRSETRFDSDFPERLKAGFLKEYYTRYYAGLRGDDLFLSLVAFVDTVTRRLGHGYSAAGIAVLAYYFHVCDLFD